MGEEFIFFRYRWGMKTKRRFGIVGLTTAVAVAATLLSSGPAATEEYTARLVNIATRAQIGGNAGTPIAGFVLSGNGTKRMLARACGPGRIQ